MIGALCIGNYTRTNQSDDPTTNNQDVCSHARVTTWRQNKESNFQVQQLRQALLAAPPIQENNEIADVHGNRETFERRELPTVAPPRVSLQTSYRRRR